MADQNPRSSRSANASGKKNGKPSGTSINVSFANAEIAVRSPCFVQAMIKASMLTRGSVNNRPPIRGYFGPISVTATTIAPAMMPLNRVSHIVFYPQRGIEAQYE
jgi:hypothetical protein